GQGDKVAGKPRQSCNLFTRDFNSIRQLLCLYDLNGPVLGIYNRDHDYRVSLLNRSARSCCRFLAAEGTFGLSVHS
ncbi:MAG: hypothetical protein WBF50_17310, partial [Pseudolabrys sp.]